VRRRALDGIVHLDPGGNSMPQLTNLAFFRARPGQTEALGAALAALVAPTRGEAGCLNYDLYQSIENAEIWFVYENWCSMQDLDRT
jgi:quinol monooxygenase YgiN